MNDGKMFEKICREQIQEIAYIYRINDFGNFIGIKNPCDHFSYKYPYFYLLENKAYSGASLPLKAISDYQVESMTKAREHKGILSYLLVWYIDKDVTRAIPIEVINDIKKTNKKSIRYDYQDERIIEVPGVKKRKYFVYDWLKFFKEAASNEENNGKSRKTVGRTGTYRSRSSKKVLRYPRYLCRTHTRCIR